MYEKQTWIDGSSIANEDTMNHIEEGIYNNSNNISKIGKLLWEGTFTSGSITVEGISNYTAIVVDVDGVLCFGNKNNGVGGYSQYAGYQILLRSYRFTVEDDIISIDAYNTGGSDGTNNIAVKAIYGIF